jgi:hypothetical protein
MALTLAVRAAVIAPLSKASGVGEAGRLLGARARPPVSRSLADVRSGRDRRRSAPPGRSHRHRHDDDGPPMISTTSDAFYLRDLASTLPGGESASRTTSSPSTLSRRAASCHITPHSGDSGSLRGGPAENSLFQIDNDRSTSATRFSISIRNVLW